jgi:TolA-binding protein
MKKIAVLAVLACLLAVPALAGGMRPKIAILAFDSSLDKKFATVVESMPDLLTACFTAQNVPADIVDRSALSAITAEQTANFDPSKFREVEGATHLLRGSLAPHNGDVVITLMLYDLASTKLVASATASGGTGEMPETACTGVKGLGAKIPALKAQAAPSQGQDDKQAERSRLMMEGLGAYYNGAFEKAFPSFLKLMRDDPSDAAAAYWLGKSYQGAGMMDEARIEFTHFVANFPKDARTAEVEGILKSMEGKHE